MIKIIYEDNHLLVVVKPFNKLSQTDITSDASIQDDLKDYLKEKYKKPGNVYLGLVHRLDRPVGGLMVFAKTSKAAARLSEQIKKHQFDKKYVAVVDGLFEQKKGILKNYITKLENGNSIITNENSGKEALLEYEVIDENVKENKSLVTINLLTGRHHQIRVQFAFINHPICGDQRYGRASSFPLALFAYQLSFYHPITKEFLTFQEAPIMSEYFQIFTCQNLLKDVKKEK